ncbi:hypothetical protein P43SY_004836 [Pythium insidiosum]|uniref:Uncharacterized protein n=1 Tax=Pythium insidiosum TaxID=114742 RepID=A0AAD5LNA2_PYTIN|nr:hypothetical protein P43SY_004836 [Pythium insidiosum]
MAGNTFGKDEQGNEILWSSRGQQVMMAWERQYMHACVDALGIQRSDRVLEIGFGLAYSATRIQSYRPRSHTIIECDSAVLLQAHAFAADQPGEVTIVEGTWQRMLPVLGDFDCIFFDDYPLPENESEFPSPLKHSTRYSRWYAFLDVVLHHANGNARISGYMARPVDLHRAGCEFTMTRVAVAQTDNCNYFPHQEAIVPLVRVVDLARARASRRHAIQDRIAAARERLDMHALDEQLDEDNEQTCREPASVLPLYGTQAARNDVLLKKRLMEVEDYQAEIRSGRKYSKEELKERFGTTVLPIPVPLARGESTQQYESRFLEWLRSSNNLQLSDLRNDPNKERSLRFSFALRAGNSLPSSREDNTDTSSGSEGGVPRVVDLTEDDDRSSLRNAPGNQVSASIVQAVQSITPSELLRLHNAAPTQDRGHRGLRADDDAIERQLQFEYDDLNERVLANERVLESAAARLADVPVDDIREAVKRQDEIRELRGLVLEEKDNRNAALAMLIVYKWKNAQRELEQRISTPAATDVPQAQQRCHHNCAAIADQLKKRRQATEALRQDLERALDAATAAPTGPRATEHLEQVAQLGKRVAASEKAIRELVESLRGEFATVIHFDEQLRHLIRTLLSQAS